MTHYEAKEVKALREFLSKLHAGPVETEQSKLVELLMNAWDRFDGNDQEEMAAWKLERAEDLRWDPPILSFTIERHGATALGSTRAELQKWHVNMDLLTADQWSSGYRQLEKRDKPLDAKKLANQIADEILRCQRTANLTWRADNLVRVNIAVVIPETVKETTQKRRQRLRFELIDALSPHGWYLKSGTRQWTFERS